MRFKIFVNQPQLNEMMVHLTCSGLNNLRLNCIFDPLTI